MKSKEIENKTNNVISMNNENTRKKRINKKKLIVFIIVLIIVLFIATILFVYSINVQFRNFCDEHIFSKDISEDNLPSIEIDDTTSSKIFAWADKIAVMKDNTISKYSSVGKKEADIKIEITTPIIATNGDYAVIAEEKGQRIYLLYKNEIVWQKDLEGNISRVSINSNGYISVILSGTSYKSVIAVFDDKGNELFKTYLSSTIAVDSTISDDNKYLSFAEVNISGTLIKSTIKQMSIEKAKEDPNNAIVNTYTADDGSLIINIEYQNKSNLVCEYDNSIHIIENNVDKKIMDLDESGKDNKFVDIDLNNYIVKTTENKENLFNITTTIELTNSSNQKSNLYTLNGTIKEIYCCENRIGINIGSEIHFIDTNGWLVKKYTANQEVRSVTMSNNIAGIIYKDKIEIINL